MDMSTQTATRLKIYISSTDTLSHEPLYEALVFAARRYGMAGVTVLKGIVGYGSSSVIHSQRFWELSEKLPVVVEIVDEAQKVENFVQKILPWFQKIQSGCLITSEATSVLLYKKGLKKKK